MEDKKEFLSEKPEEMTLDNYMDMSSSWLGCAESVLTGKGLMDAVHNTPDSPEPLIDGFLYKESVLMIFADSGVGKSIATLGAMLQACSGNPVFGELETPNPITVYWILGERSPIEPLSRMRRMLNGIKGFLPYRFILDCGMQEFDLLTEIGQREALGKLERVNTVNPIDVVVFDPIYAMVSGGLTEDKPATAFTRFSTRVQKTLQCSNILVHHTNRGSRDQKGNRQAGDMYGSRWLDAHVSGVFHLKNNGNDAKLVRKKDNHSVLLEEIPLHYDAETDLCYMNLSKGGIKKVDQLKLWLAEQKRLGKTFEFNDMREAIQVSTSGMRKIISTHQNLPYVEVSKTLKNKKLYKAV